MPSLVRIARAFGSGIEWVMVISSSSNGPRLILPPSGISVIGHLVHQAGLAQLAPQDEAVNGVA